MNDILPNQSGESRKVLIVSDAWHPQVNGVVRTYEYIAEELEAMGHDVRVIGPADFRFSFPMPGYEEISLVVNPYNRLVRLIGEYRPDYIHAATEGPLGWATRRYCIKNRKPFTTSYHTQFPDYFAKRVAKSLPFLYRHSHSFAVKYVRKFHSPAHAMMVATASLEAELKSWNFKVRMCPFTRGVNTNIFHPGESTLFHDLKRPVAIYVGRVAIEKNLEAFLDMDWEGTKIIVGDGPSMKDLQKKYPQAIFAGRQVGRDLADHYRSADVFVFPSRTDTFGIVLIEALACGLPVAAYDVIGPKDIITRPFLGVLDENLSRAARRAIECGSPEERSRHIQENYSWRLAARQFMEAFV